MKRVLNAEDQAFPQALERIHDGKGRKPGHCSAAGPLVRS